MARDLERLAAPAMIVHGQEDRIVPAALARWVARRSESIALAILDDCGHLPHLEIPGRFLDAIWPHLVAAGDPCAPRCRGLVDG
jgi:pimeloyl-ACP methyl ester carboxylesterase